MKSLWQVNVVVDHDANVPDNAIMAALALGAARMLSDFWWKGSAVAVADVAGVRRMGGPR